MPKRDAYITNVLIFFTIWKINVGNLFPFCQYDYVTWIRVNNCPLTTALKGPISTSLCCISQWVRIVGWIQYHYFIHTFWDRKLETNISVLEKVAQSLQFDSTLSLVPLIAVPAKVEPDITPVCYLKEFFELTSYRSNRMQLQSRNPKYKNYPGST